MVCIFFTRNLHLLDDEWEFHYILKSWNIIVLPFWVIIMTNPNRISSFKLLHLKCSLFQPMTYFLIFNTLNLKICWLNTFSYLFWKILKAVAFFFSNLTQHYNQLYFFLSYHFPKVPHSLFSRPLCCNVASFALNTKSIYKRSIDIGLFIVKVFFIA